MHIFTVHRGIYQGNKITKNKQKNITGKHEVIKRAKLGKR